MDTRRGLGVRQQPAAEDLAPAARRGAKVDRARNAVEEAKLLIDLQELEGRARTPALLACAPVVDVALVLGVLA